MADDKRSRLIDEANKIFDKMKKLTEEQVAKGAKTLNLVEIINQAGLKVDEALLTHLEIPVQFIPIPFVGWENYFPWKPLWSYYWGLHYPGSFAARAYITSASAGVTHAGSVKAGGFGLGNMISDFSIALP